MNETLFLFFAVSGAVFWAGLIGGGVLALLYWFAWVFADREEPITHVGQISNKRRIFG